jgi:hypothetical protein
MFYRCALNLKNKVGCHVDETQGGKLSFIWSNNCVANMHVNLDVGASNFAKC